MLGHLSFLKWIISVILKLSSDVSILMEEFMAI